MKTLRKSINSHKEHISSPLPALSKPISAIQPPMKVIRALTSRKATAPQEISFEKGDFFHVIKDDNQGQWYEAHNPMTGARGLVPCSMFEEFMKGAATPRTSSAVPHSRPQSPSSPKTQAFFAVVLHDFQAERADELDARAGDTISVVAQSNREWFVAKPIDKLGRPGLIPVTFVEIRDPATRQPVRDINALIDSGALPRVEDWKRQIMTYKANSISLGVLDEANIQPTTFASAGAQLAADTANPLSHRVIDDPSQRAEVVRSSSFSPKDLPHGILISASVASFHYESDEYWFRVHAVFQPYGTDFLPSARRLVLYRSYDDFYDFQVQLLESFPQEAGRDGADRILPFMPGPAHHVDNDITVTRRQELDQYLHELCELRSSVRYILEHQLVRQFFAIKPGDVSTDIEAQTTEIEALDQTNHMADAGNEEVDEQFSRMSLSKGADSGYEEGDGYGSRKSGYGSRSSIEGHQRMQSTSSISRQPSSGVPQVMYTHSRSSSRTNSVLGRSGVYEHGRSQSSLEIDPYRANGYSRTSLASSHDRSPVRLSNAPSLAETSTSGRSRSHSAAVLNSPPISATIPQTAFLKIKIYDNKTADLVAIRVHPRIAHSQLLEKVQSRLGGRAVSLSYRDSENNSFELDNDEELRYWLDSTERHMLYAS